MIESVTKDHHYHVLFFNSDAEEREHGVQAVKNITEAFGYLNSEKGKKRMGPKLTDNVSAHSHIINNFTEITHYLEGKKQAKPAMIILDQGVSDEDVMMLKNWITSWIEEEPIYLLNIKPDAKTTFSEQNYAEATPDILDSKNKAKLCNELATGVMYAHHARHETLGASIDGP